MATYQTDDGEWTIGDTAKVEIKDERDDLPIFVHSELDDLPISADAFRVYAHLARRRNKDKKAAWPSYASMGRTCFGTENMKPDSMRSKVIRAINELVRFGLIVVERRTGLDGRDITNWYRLTPRSEWHPKGDKGGVIPSHPPSDPPSLRGDPPSPKGTTSIQGEQEEEKQESEVTPASQAQPLSLQDQLMALNGNGPANSSRTEKKERKPRSPKVTSVSPGDANNCHREMFTALATLCKVDPKLKRGQLNATAKDLRDAGYLPADLDKFANWWYSQDFRGKQGQPPAIGLVPSLILQAVQWVPQTAWVPPVQAAKPKGYDLSTLRSWHKQHYYEEWNYRVAAELGISPTLPGAFKEWYESEASIPDDQLAAWYEQHIAASKEKQQW